MTQQCTCPTGAQVELGSVVVSGHEVSCVHGEPRRYVWQDGGHLQVGTLADYARTWEHHAYSGDSDLSGELRTWTESYRLRVEPLGADDNDWMHYRLTIGNESVYVQIDGRS
ncbi:hypothetical protein [Actinomadura nitritigenes]|uniref:hypothetical protein n=1 Tax=Actinomadura nitritigenes TaxID=134602 RepID=UPI003D93B916